MSQRFWHHLFFHQPKQAVLVLGSGRSGTSVMTKALNLMGVSLGTAELLAPSKRINPKGYFENKDVIKIHKALGSRIRYRPAFQGYYDSPKIKHDRQALTAYLTTSFERQAVMAIKDPRMNDYIQLWQHVLADINVQPAEVILLRNPLDVVASNSRAWHRDQTLALRQWQVRTLLSLRDTQPQSRVLVTYEDLFDQPLATLKRIATKFNLAWPADEGLLQAQLDDFIDPSLQHSDRGESLAEFEARPDVDADVKALYRLGRRAAADADFFASTDFQQQIEALLQAYLTRYGALYRDFNAKIDHQTYLVFGDHQETVNQVNDLLAAQDVTMVGPEAPIHKTAQAVSEQLSSGELTVPDYPKAYSIVEAKEALNNYLRHNAKTTARWGIGDAQNNAIVELWTTVSAELGADTHNLVLVDDLMAIDEAAELRLAVQRLTRTLRAVQRPPYLIVMTSTLAEPATVEAINAFVQAAPTKTTLPVDTQPNDVFRLRTPIDWHETAVALTDLCRAASVEPQAQSALNHFINLNATEILTTKGDQYAESLRN